MKFRYLKNVVTLELDSEKCNACGMCVKVCPHAVFAMNIKVMSIVNRDLCMECGACATNCEQEAISVQSGVGCASGIIKGALTNSEPTCGCSDSKSTCC